MLCLTRKKNETTVIEIDGQTLTIKVDKIGDNKVRMLFTGPQAFAIRRGELPPRDKAEGTP